MQTVWYWKKINRTEQGTQNRPHKVKSSCFLMKVKSNSIGERVSAPNGSGANGHPQIKEINQKNTAQPK